MTEMVEVLRAEDYFETYGRYGLAQGHPRAIVRAEMLRRFREEIFGLIAMRGKKTFDTIPPEGDPEAMRIARNVIRDETKKWIKICRIFERYEETRGVFKPEDIAADEIIAAAAEKNGTEGITHGTYKKGKVLGTEIVDMDIPEDPEDSEGGGPDSPEEGMGPVLYSPGA